jgi:hypothetical protein
LADRDLGRPVPDIYETLCSAYVSRGMELKEAEDIIEKLKEEERYVLEVSRTHFAGGSRVDIVIHRFTEIHPESFTISQTYQRLVK